MHGTGCTAAAPAAVGAIPHTTHRWPHYSAIPLGAGGRTTSPRERTQNQAEEAEELESPDRPINAIHFARVNCSRTRCAHALLARVVRPAAYVKALLKGFNVHLCFILEVVPLVRYCVVKITVFSLCLLTPLQEVAIWARDPELRRA